MGDKQLTQIDYEYIDLLLDQANKRYSYLCETITNFSNDYLLRDLDN